MAVTTTQVQQLYLAYFGRPAEQAGLNYWTSQANANVTDISAAFAQSSEYTNVYGSLTRAQTIDTLYQNLFGRSAESNELTYWLNSTDVSISNLALALTNGATGTDRLLLDSKAQYAATVTANAGASGTATGVANTYAAVTPTTSAGYQAANTAAKAAVAPTITDASTATSVDFQGLTAGTITLSSLNSAHTLALPTTSNLVTDLTVKGTVDGAASLTVTEGATTDIITALHVNVSSNATTASDGVLTIDPSSSSALTTFDGASSTAGLKVGTTGSHLVLESLNSLTTGSGVDTLFVDSGTTTKAAALTIDTGAGNDAITSVVNLGALTINSGLGNDTISVTTGNAVLTVNAGAGNDVVNLTGTAATATAAHTASITLGDGSDTLNISSLVNLSGTFTTGTSATNTVANAAIAEDLIKVTDFSASQDTLNIASAGGGSYVALTNAQQATVSSAASLAEALTAAAAAVAGSTAASHSTAFQYGGNTYVFIDHTTAAAVTTGDGLIELTGFTGTLSSSNFVTA